MSWPLPEKPRPTSFGDEGFGFSSFLKPEVQSPIITAFRCLRDPAFSFEDFYRRLSDRGMIIYPGKLTHADTFRIGNIGRLFPAEMEQLVQAIEASLRLMFPPDRPIIPVRVSFANSFM